MCTLKFSPGPQSRVLPALDYIFRELSDDNITPFQRIPNSISKRDSRSKYRETQKKNEIVLIQFNTTDEVTQFVCEGDKINTFRLFVREREYSSEWITS